VRHPEADIRPWLAEHPRVGSAYARQRIDESYDHIDGILCHFGDLASGSALDVGCGEGLDDFALAGYFDRVDAIDSSPLRVWPARVLARRAGVRRVRFVRADAETHSRGREYDFIYCNIMSELARSRQRLVTRLVESCGQDGAIFYAEETEGYAPLEIRHAIDTQDYPQLCMRLHQTVNGLCGLPAFRFYLSGTASSLFEQHGLEVVHRQTVEHAGTVTVDAVWVRGDSRCAGATGPDPDYARLPDEFRAVRELCQARIREGAGSSTLLDDAHEPGRFSRYLILAAMAVEVLGDELGRPPVLRRRLRHRAVARSAAHTLGWAHLEELLADFERLKPTP
jgi:SAM-dependent methyltransferase